MRDIRIMCATAAHTTATLGLWRLCGGSRTAEAPCKLFSSIAMTLCKLAKLRSGAQVVEANGMWEVGCVLPHVATPGSYSAAARLGL